MLQRDQRGNHEGQAVKQQRGHLIDRGLTRAGGQHGQQVMPSHDLLHGLELLVVQL